MKIGGILTSLALTMVMSATPGLAQIANTPGIGERIAAMGKNFGPDIIKVSIGLYVPLHAKADKTGIEVERDLAYGPDPRHLLDVHTPAVRPANPVPTVIFIHGGAFVAGDKSRGGLIYDNIATYFARHDLVGVNATYRLAPKHPWPAGGEDVAAMVRWTRANIARYGGNPERIYLMGHSAGAVHAATYIFKEEFQPADGKDGIAGAILLSGQYRPKDTPVDYAYYGEDKSTWPERELFRFIDGRKVPLFIITAELDLFEMEVDGAQLYTDICRRDQACPRFTRILGHNHLTMVTHIDTKDESIGPELVDFVRNGR